MKIHSYIITSDTGFSPNPFWGVCTLACCKPVIRRTADIGDWIVGLRGKVLYNKLRLPQITDPLKKYAIIYAMKVTEILPFDKYYRRFPKKRPNFNKAETIYKRGDNIYEPIGNDEYKQLPSRHKEKDKPKDLLNGKYVLISNEFFYFGSNPLEIPNNLRALVCGRETKCNFDDAIKCSFVKYISSKNRGVSAKPSLWRENDNSWKQ